MGPSGLPPPFRRAVRRLFECLRVGPRLGSSNYLSLRGQIEIVGKGVWCGYILDGCDHSRRVECAWVSLTFSPIFIFALSSSHSKILGLKTDILRDSYNSWGPSARNCLRFAEELEAIRAHEQDVLDTAFELTKTSRGSLLAMHRIFVVRPSPKSRRIAIVEFGTNLLREIFARVYAQQDQAVRYSFYKTIREHSWFDSPAGYIFEIHVLLWFWHYNTYSPLLYCTGIKANSRSLQIPLFEGNLKFFFKAEELKIIGEPGKPICLVPTSGTFFSLNAIVLTNNAVITVQITIALEHDAKEEEFDLIYRNLPPGLLEKRPHRCHVFITDKEITAKSLREQNHTQIPNGTLVYSTAISVGSMDSSIPATEERIDALEKARVSVHWLYVIWCLLGNM